MWSDVNSFSIVHCLNNCLIQQNCNYSWNLPTFLSPCPVWSERFELSRSGISGFLPLITYNFTEVRKNCVWRREGNFWKGTGKPSKMRPCCDPSSFPSSISLTKLCPNHWKTPQTPAHFSAVVEPSKIACIAMEKPWLYFKVKTELVKDWQLYSWKLLMESIAGTSRAGSREMLDFWSNPSLVSLLR